MSNQTYRVNKTREDKAVDELVATLIAAGGYNVVFSLPDLLFHGLQRLICAQIEDGEEILREQGATPDSFQPEEEKRIYIEHLTQCAWQYFHEQKAEKFRVALIELIHESIYFSDAIYAERCGLDEKEVNEARPTFADIQQNVLRRSIQRLRELPMRGETGMELAENDPRTHPIYRANYEVLNNLMLWTYNPVRVYEHLREALRLGYEEKGRSPEEANYNAHAFAREMAELVRENIGTAVGTMVRIMFGLVWTVAAPLWAQRHNVEDPEIEGHKTSAGKFKDQFATKMIDDWLKEFLPLLRGSGRSLKDAESTESEREQFRWQVIDAMLRVLDEPEKISQEAVVKKLPKSERQVKSASALRNKLRRLNLEWQELKREATEEHIKKRIRN